MSFENVEDVYTLSPMQAGMLYHTIAGPDSGVFIQQVCLTLQGPLDVDAFQKSWELLVRRHPVLRTVFLWDGLDEPLQVIRQDASIAFRHVDWRGLAVAEQQSRLASFLRDDRRRGFDLAQAPLMRLTLAREDTDRHRFIWGFHHLSWDGWSTPILLKELWAIYAGLRQGSAPDVTPTFQFRDYIAWLREQDLSAAKRFWQSTLGGFTGPTRLRVVNFTAAPSNEDRRYDQQRRTLSHSDTAQLKSFARQHRLTLNTVVHGAWALLLSRYGGEEDVVYGVTVSGRPPDLPGIERAVGMFINTLPCRVRAEADHALIDWLQQLQTNQLEMRRYEYTPLASIQSWSDVPRGEALFESIVVFENYPETVTEITELEIPQIEYFEQSNYPLALLVVPGEDLELIVVHDTGYVDAAAASGILSHLEALLQSFVKHASDPTADVVLAELSLLSDAEQHELHVRRNGSVAPYPRDVCVHQLIEARAEQHPDMIAIDSHDYQLTYRQLDRRANLLARQLRSLGVGPDVPVALLAERSPAMIVGMLGILKAGGAYVPLDATYPKDHLELILKDVGASVLATHSSLADVLSNDARAVVCIIDDVSESTSAEITNETFHGTTSENLAYIIYTSGSTGIPNGVPITHRNLVHSTTARLQYYPNQVGRFLLLSSHAFDSSVAGIFWTLCSGGTLVLPPPRLEQDMQGLLELFMNRRVSHVLCLPSLYAVILQHAERRHLESLVTVIVAGEACPASLVGQHHGLLPNTELYNEYGPTEATVWSSVYKTQPADDTGPVPIGMPIANMRAQIFDQHLRPLPDGVCGELFLAGDGLTNGYWNRPDLDQKRFVNVEAADLPAARWYRTGDLACCRPDGNLLFMGRADRQVKIRGYRVELDEIEAVLMQHPSLADAAVVIRDGQPRAVDAIGVSDFTPQSLDDRVSTLRAPMALRLLSELESLSEDDVDSMLAEHFP